MIKVVLCTLLSTAAIVLLLSVLVVAGGLWAYRVLKVNALVAYRCKDSPARKKYFESRYDEQFALIKWRVVNHLRNHQNPRFKELAELLAYAKEPIIWKEESSSSKTLFIELDESVNAVEVDDAPADLLKDLGRLERAADILGVEYAE